MVRALWLVLVLGEQELAINQIMTTMDKTENTQSLKRERSKNDLSSLDVDDHFEAAPEVEPVLTTDTSTKWPTASTPAALTMSTLTQDDVSDAFDRYEATAEQASNHPFPGLSGSTETLERHQFSGSGNGNKPLTLVVLIKSVAPSSMAGQVKTKCIVISARANDDIGTYACVHDPSENVTAPANVFMVTCLKALDKKVASGHTKGLGNPKCRLPGTTLVLIGSLIDVQMSFEGKIQPLAGNTYRISAELVEWKEKTPPAGDFGLHSTS